MIASSSLGHQKDHHIMSEFFDMSDSSTDQSVKLDLPGELYYLTMLQEGDRADLQEILAMDSVSDRLLFIPKPYTMEDADYWVTNRCASNISLLSIPTLSERTKTFFSQTHAVPLQAIRHGPTGKFVGCVSLTPRGSDNVVELGYYLHPAHHGKRIVPAAAKVALKWAKEEFGVVNIYGSADCCNPRSERVMEKVSRETSVREVRKGVKVLHWPVEKKIEGRDVDSLSKTWEWTI